ncbi:MAG TPA: hypothetical protein VIA62_16880 [Thermoanaerobaculia bacterium]|jgi:hypothetical protein|nr:hypothetical protein [Thermoanaerobaculia bacterium]
MPFEDFKRDWTVITEDDAECPINSTVTISGKADSVEITCKLGEATQKPYPPGKYNKDTNRIEVKREDDTVAYQIGLQIMFAPPDPGQTPITGSWTAEDQGPWPGDE